MRRHALPLLSGVLFLAAGCMSVDSGGPGGPQQASPGNCGCPGNFGRSSGPPAVPGLQDSSGRPYAMYGPYAANPPGNAWVAMNMMNSSVPLDKLQFGGVNQGINDPNLARAGFNRPMMPVPPGGTISPAGMPAAPGMSGGMMPAGGFPPGGVPPNMSGGVQQAQYGYSPPPRGYAPNSGAPPWQANYYRPNYPSYYPNPYQGNTSYYPPQARPGYDPSLQKAQYSNFAPNPVPPDPGLPAMMRGSSASPMGGQSCPPASCQLTQVKFNRPIGMKVQWYTMGPDGRPVYNSIPLQVPGRYDFPQGAVYRLKLTNIDERPQLEVYPTMEIMPGNSKTESFLSHSAVPLEFTNEDFKQIVESNYVVKVIYLPDPQFQDVAGTGTDEILSTRLEPGADPVQEARKRGTVLAVIRMGNIHQELDHTPPRGIPNTTMAGPGPGYGPMSPMAVPGCPPGYGGNGRGWGPFGLGPPVYGLPPISARQQTVQLPYFGSQYGNYCSPQYCPPGMCPPGVFPGQPGTPGTPGSPGMTPYGAPGSYYPEKAAKPATPTTSMGKNPPKLLSPPTASTPVPDLPPPSAEPTSLPEPSVSKSSPVSKPAATPAAPTPAAPKSSSAEAVPPVLPDLPEASPSTLPGPPTDEIAPSNPPLKVDGPEGPLEGPPPETPAAPATPSQSSAPGQSATPAPMSNGLPMIPSPPMGPSEPSAKPAPIPDAPPSIPSPPPSGVPEVSPPPAPTAPEKLKPTPGLSEVMPPKDAPSSSASTGKVSAFPDLPKIPEPPLAAPKPLLDPNAMPAFPPSAALILPAPPPPSAPGTAPAPKTAPSSTGIPTVTEPPLATPMAPATPTTLEPPPGP